MLQRGVLSPGTWAAISPRLFRTLVQYINVRQPHDLAVKNVPKLLFAVNYSEVEESGTNCVLTWKLEPVNIFSSW